MLAKIWLLSILTFVISSPVRDPSKAISEECEQCYFAAELAHLAWGTDTMEKCMGDFVIFMCETLHVETNFICRNMVGEYKDEAMWVLGQVLVTPSEICGLLVKDCGHVYDPLTASWSLYLPENKPPVIPKVPPPPGKPTLRVLHLTDIHIDKDYIIGSEAECSESISICCRPPTDTTELDGKADGIKLPAGRWGSNAFCDAPYWMVDNMLMQIRQRHKDIDYVLVTGDLESHAIWDYTKETHAARLSNVTDMIRSYFPDKMVYFTLGNHEGVPIDSFAPHWTPSEYNMTWLYGTIANKWQGWVPDDQMTTLRYNGCYMKKLWPGLRLISLNNGYGDSLNMFLLINQTDPDGAMSWFVNQLLDAEKAGDKVHVISHVPGGNGEAYEGWSLVYYHIAIRFENTIAAHMFGHVHSEQFYMIYENPEDHTSRPIDVIYSAPSVTPYSRYNPTYRMYTIDGNYPGSSYRIIDWEEYFLNLTIANAPPYQPIWDYLYPSVLQEYNLTANVPSEWDRLINRMKDDDGLFLIFLKNYYRRTDYMGKYPCDTRKCKMNHLCIQRKAHHAKHLCDDLEGATGTQEPDRKPRPPPTRDDIIRSFEERKKKGIFAEKCVI